MAEREIVMLDERSYPSNSHQSKQRKKENDVVVEKIVQATVQKKKKSFLSRFKEDVCVEDAGTIGEYIIYDVLIPAVKDLLFDMIKGGTERALFGDTKPSSDRIRHDRGESYVSYSRYYNDRRRSSERGSSRRKSRDCDDLIFKSRGEAVSVLDRMEDMIEEYGQVSLYDVYAMCDISGDYTDQKWGWEGDALKEACVVRVREGYLLTLPRTVVL